MRLQFGLKDPISHSWQFVPAMNTRTQDYTASTLDVVYSRAEPSSKRLLEVEKYRVVMMCIQVESKLRLHSFLLFFSLDLQDCLSFFFLFLFLVIRFCMDVISGHGVISSFILIGSVPLDHIRGGRSHCTGSKRVLFPPFSSYSTKNLSKLTFIRFTSKQEVYISYYQNQSTRYLTNED